MPLPASMQDESHGRGNRKARQCQPGKPAAAARVAAAELHDLVVPVVT
jgi:hypothetical protein